MAKQTISAAARAKHLWDRRELEALKKLCRTVEGREDARVQYYGGLAHHAAGRKRDAIDCWRQSMSLKPNYDAPIRALAHEFEHEELYIEAVPLLTTLDRLGKATADDLTLLGEIRIKQDRLAEARQYLERALELEPENSLSLLSMANLFAHWRDRSSTLQYLKRVAAIADMDMTDLADDPVFEFLWPDSTFKRLIA